MGGTIPAPVAVAPERLQLAERSRSLSATTAQGMAVLSRADGAPGANDDVQRMRYRSSPPSPSPSLSSLLLYSVSQTCAIT